MIHRPLIALAAAALMLGGCFDSYQKAQRVETHRVPHIEGSGLEVKTRNGTVSATADSGMFEVTIEARIVCTGPTLAEAQARLDQSTLEIERKEDDTLVIRPVFAGGGRNGDGASITIQAPDLGDAFLRTSNGRIVVRDLAGSLIADTSNGAVEVARIGGSARIDTSNGSIDAREVGGPVDADTSNGSVQVRLRPGQSGPVSARTSNGSITVHLGEGFAGAVSMSTSNSRVHVDDAGGRITSSNLNRSGGRIVIESDRTLSRLATSNGSIRVVVE